MAEARLLDVSTRVIAEGAEATRPGDSVQLVAHAQVDGDAQARFPEAERLEEILAGKGLVLDGPRLSRSGEVYEAAWTVQVLLPPGEQELGPVPVALVDAEGRVLEEIEAPAAPLTVASALPEELAARLDEAAGQGALPQVVAEELAPVRGPWTLKGRLPWEAALGGGLLLLLLALLAAWAWRRWRRSRAPVAAPAPPPPPPEVEARERLARLPALLDRGEHLAFHVELAWVLKRYLGRRYDRDLLESTTDEVRRLLQGPLKSAANLPRCRDDVVSVLSACDLVKFARDLPERGSSLRLLETVESVVARTTPAPPAAEVAA